MKKNKIIIFVSLLNSLVLQFINISIAFNNKICDADGPSSGPRQLKYELYDKVFGSSTEPIGTVTMNVRLMSLGDVFFKLLWTNEEVDPLVVSGYKFCGYVEEGCNVLLFNENGKSCFTTESDSYTMYGSNRYLVAKWEESSTTTTTVTLSDGDGATGGSGSVEATNGEVIKDVNVPKKENHSFQGYWTEASGGTQYIGSDGKCIKNWDKTDATYTLYAHWNYEMPNAIAFASSFNTTIGGICNPYGGTSKSSLEAVWGTENKEVDTLSKAFFALNEVAQGILTAAKRPTQSTSTDPLELFAAKYDYVCGKYSLYNFASRTPLYPQSATPYKINDVADGSNASIIIILIACISSALAIGGYFLIKRKREE